MTQVMGESWPSGHTGCIVDMADLAGNGVTGVCPQQPGPGFFAASGEVWYNLWHGLLTSGSSPPDCLAGCDTEPPHSDAKGTLMAGLSDTLQQDTQPRLGLPVWSSRARLSGGLPRSSVGHGLPLPSPLFPAVDASVHLDRFPLNLQVGCRVSKGMAALPDRGGAK